MLGLLVFPVFLKASSEWWKPLFFSVSYICLGLFQLIDLVTLNVVFLSLCPSGINLLFFVEKQLRGCFHRWLWEHTVCPDRQKDNKPGWKKKQKKNPLTSPLWRLCRGKAPCWHCLHYLFEWQQLYKRLLRMWPPSSIWFAPRGRVWGENAWRYHYLEGNLKRNTAQVSTWFKILLF